MPNRDIKESALSSATLYRLSDGAERLFWRMTLVADDYGRFEAAPQILKARCFPLWPDCKMPARRVADRYAELERAGLVVSYISNGKQYGYFPTWEKHQGKPRAKHSKFPEPTSENICTQMPADVPVSSSLRNTNTTETTDSRLSDGSIAVRGVSGSGDSFEVFYQRYPRKVGKDAARTAWGRALEKVRPADIMAGLERQLPQLLARDPKYVPHPATWLNQGRWQDEPDRAPLLSPKTGPGNIAALRDFARSNYDDRQ